METSNSDKIRHRQIRLKMSLIFFVLTVIGISSIYLEISKTKYELQNDYIRDSKVVASSVGASEIEKLTGNYIDTATPTFIHIKQDLTKSRKVIPKCRFIYIMGIKHSKIFFYLDSEPSDSKDYSPPGQIYTEASSTIYKVFETKQSLFEGPYNDRWGRWFSSFVPILNKETGAVVAVVGVDISFSDWYYHIAKNSAIPIFLILCAVVLIILSFSLGQKAIYNKQKAEQIAESEAKFRQMFSAHKAVMLIIDPDTGEIINANESAVSFYGYSHMQLCSMNITEINCIDKNSVKQSMQNAILNEKNEFIVKHILASGDIRYVEVLSSPFATERGMFLFSIVNDITEKLEFEKKILESEKRFEEMALAVDEVFVLRTKDKVLYVNPQLENLFGISCQSMYDNPNAFLSLIFEEDRNRIVNYIHNVDFTNNGFTNEEYRITRPNGEIRWIWAKTFPIIESDGTVEKIAIVASDITHRKITEAEKEKADDSLRTLKVAIEQSPVTIVISDLNGKIEYVNPKYTESTGYTLDEAIGQNMKILKPDTISSSEYYDLWQTILGGEMWNGIFQNKKKNGEQYLESVIISPVKDDTGKITHFLAINEDITKQKQLELDLIKSKEDAITANVAKSEFLATMSHEIRTPLNGVIGFSEILMKTKLTGKQSEYMKNLHVSANSLLDLVNDILDFSKIEVGKLELHPEKIDIIELSENIMEIMKFRASEKGIETLLRISPTMPHFVFADPVRLRQVLVNLLGNAIKFTEKGEIELSIDATSIEGNNSEMEYSFSVRDTGIGIPDDKLQTIFESFSQADGSTTRKYGGTGLGLSISNNLVNKMGSKIDVESEMGQGSCFRFSVSLPFEYKQNEELYDVSWVKKILIIDDNATNRSILEEMLRQKNVETIQTPNSLIAMELIENNNDYDVILVDYHMPFVDGLQVISNIRNNEKNKNQNIILMHSSNDDESVLTECSSLNVHIVLQKPIKMNQLYKAIASIHSTATNQTIIEDLEIEKIELSDKTFRKYTIMIVDDNQMNINLSSALISMNMPNAEIITTQNGTEAQTLYLQHKPDLILMDIQMPIMNGYEAAQSIRSTDLDKKKRIPIIALTAGTIIGEKERCMDAGMDDYLSKPLHIQSLFKMFDTYLFGNSSEIIDVPQPISNDEIHFDVNELLKLYNNNNDFVQKMVKMAFESIPPYISEMELAMQNNDSKQIKFNAHTIKGMAKGISFNALSAIALKIEKNAETDLHLCIRLNEDLKKEFAFLQQHQG